MGAVPALVPNLSYGVRLRSSAGRKSGFLVPPSSAVTSSAAVVTRGSEMELENRKFELLRAVMDTQRGLVATSSQRSSIEEAMVNVETFDAGNPVDYRLLDGTWRLQYTSAPDVLILFQAATLPFFKVGQVFQKFECQNESNKGIVRNIVQWSVPGLLEDQEGASLIVSADFSVVSKRNIQLEFQKVAVQSISISEELQALLAPALLPRSFFNLQILQFIKSFSAEVPLTRTSPRGYVGGLYYLSFLDNNMLLGRSIGGGGVFVFSRSQPFIL